MRLVTPPGSTASSRPCLSNQPLQRAALRPAAERLLRQTDMPKRDDIPWKSAEVTHEGFPLMLRCPQDLPYHLQEELPTLVALTHHLDSVTDSGLPSPDYNESLADFDDAASRLFSSESEGAVVLIETFGGRRSYYAYASPETDVDAAVDCLTQRYSGLRLDHSVRSDPDWGFIRGYAAAYGM